MLHYFLELVTYFVCHLVLNVICHFVWGRRYVVDFRAFGALC